MSTKVIFITTSSASPFIIPYDFVSLTSVEGIGGGASGTGGANNNSNGGGAGAYAKSTSTSGLSPGKVVYLSIGVGGSQGGTNTGGDTWFNTVTNAAPASALNGIRAKGANNTTGGSAGSSVGTIVFSGGNGGDVSVGGSTSRGAKGGGGGAAGPGGAGGVGGAGVATSGGGGSGATLTVAGTAGTAGDAVVTNAGGAGGASTGQTGGTGGTTSTVAGSGFNGGGGGGSGNDATGNTFFLGGNGGTGTVWTGSFYPSYTGSGATAGPGGGAGAGAGLSGVNTTVAGNYGAGGVGGNGGNNEALSSPGILVLTYVASDAAPVTRYWVGGAGTWNSSSTSNWSTSSGGTSGASVPGGLDAAIFDSNSGAGTVTISGTVNIGSINTTGSSFTFAGTATPVLTVVGSFNLSSTTVWDSTVGTLTFADTGTITTNGVTLNNSIIFGTTWNPNAVFTLGSSLTIPTTATTTFTFGTLALGSYTLSTGLFSSSNSNTRVIQFGTGAITVTGSGVNLWICTIATNLTYTGTPTVNISNNSATASTVNHGSTGGAVTNAFDFNFTTGTYALTLASASNIRALNFTGFTGTWSPLTASCTYWGSVTLVSGMTFTTGTGTWTFAATSGTQVITSASKTLYSITQNGVGGTVQFASDTTLSNTYTLTNGTLDIGTNNVTLSCNTFSSSNSNARAIQFGTGNITVTGSGTAWTTGTATGLTYTGTPTVNISNNSATATTVNASGTGGAVTNAFDFNFTTGTYALTLSSGNAVKSLNFTGFTGTWAPSAATCTFYGSLTLVSGMTFTTGTGLWTFAATSGTQTITSAGKTLRSITQSGAGGTVQFASDTTLSNTYTLTNGTLDIGTNNVTLSCNTFSSSNSNARAIQFGTGNITVTGSGAGWSCNNLSNFTYTGTPTVNISNNSATAGSISSAGTELNALNFYVTTGTYSLDLSASFYKSLIFTGFAGTLTLSATSPTFYGSLTLTSGMTVTPSSGALLWRHTSGTAVITGAGQTLSPLNQTTPGATVQLSGNVIATSYTLNNGTLDLNNTTLSVGVMQISSSISTPCTVAFGTGNITVTGSGTSYSAQSGQGLSYTGTPTINIVNSGSTATTIVPVSDGIGAASSNVFNFNITTGTYALTIFSQSSFNKLNFTGFTGTYAPASGVRLNFYSDLTLSSSMTYTPSVSTVNEWRWLHTTGTALITANGKTLGNNNFTQNGVGGTVQFATGTTTMIGTYTLTAGTLDIGTSAATVSMSGFSSSNTNTRAIQLGGGTVSLTGVGTVWNLTTATGMTLTPGTSTINITNTATTTKTFAGGGLTYNNLTISGSTSTSTVSITGGNTFNTLAATRTAAWTLTLPASTTTNVGAWSISGSAGNLVSINSSSTGVRSTLNYTGSGYARGSYLSIRDSAATPANTWYAE